MDHVILIEAPELERLVAEARMIVELADTGRLYRCRFAIDTGTLKVKPNELVWSPPIGRTDENAR